MVFLFGQKSLLPLLLEFGVESVKKEFIVPFITFYFILLFVRKGGKEK